MHFGEHTCVVALGIDIDSQPTPAVTGRWLDGDATLVTELIVGLRERGLDVTRPILAVLDGRRRCAARCWMYLDHPVIQRCQLHKIRSVQDWLPDKLRATVTATIRRTYHADSALAAEAELGALAAELERTHAGPPPACARA